MREEIRQPAKRATDVQQEMVRSDNVIDLVSLDHGNGCRLLPRLTNLLY